MGCSGCKNNREQSSEEKVLEVFEKSLGLQEVQALSIDRILHRYSTGDGMSISQLEKAFSELKIDHGRFQQFYYLFYDSYAYNLKKLNCLGILLGLETVQRRDPQHDRRHNRSRLCANPTRSDIREHGQQAAAKLFRANLRNP
jgi:hypothetical protein